MLKVVWFVSLVTAVTGGVEDAMHGPHHMSAGWLAFWISMAVWSYLFTGIVQLMNEGKLILLKTRGR